MHKYLMLFVVMIDIKKILIRVKIKTERAMALRFRMPLRFSMFTHEVFVIFLFS